MATIVEMINPLTGLPEQVDKLDHTAQEIDIAVARAFKVSTRNFLRNWYFVNPVNQRGVSGTISTTGYFIDGWKLVSGTVQITSTGLALNGTIEQILEDAIGQPVKATFLASDGVFDASYNDSTKTFTITATGKTLIAAALELGEFQTHFSQDSSGNWALNEIPDYGEQLRRCQRYFVNFNPYKVDWFAMPPAVAANASQAYSSVILPVAMRTQPSVSFGGKIVLSQAVDNIVTGILTSESTFTGNSIQLRYDVGAYSLTANSLYRVQGYQDNTSYIHLSADL